MNKYEKKRKSQSRYMTGEDVEIFRERENDKKKEREENICDRHMDGA